MAATAAIIRELPPHMFCRHVFTEKGTGSAKSPLASRKHRREIKRLLRTNDIVGVRAPTGAGKSREVTEMIAKEFLRKGEKTLLVTIRRAAAVSNHEVLIRDGLKFSLALFEKDGTTKEHLASRWGYHGDVRMLATFVNWMVCQGVDYAVNSYGCIVLDEFGDDYGADAQWALLELRRHLQNLDPARRPKVVLLSCVLRRSDLDWWAGSDRAVEQSCSNAGAAAALRVDLHVVEERTYDLAHYQVLDSSSEKDPCVAARSLLSSLHAGDGAGVKTMLFVPGVAQITDTIAWAEKHFEGKVKCIPTRWAGAILRPWTSLPSGAFVDCLQGR